MLCEEMNRHKDQVLHVSFSHNGQMFATCSKDGKVMVSGCLAVVVVVVVVVVAAVAK